MEPGHLRMDAGVRRHDPVGEAAPDAQPPSVSSRARPGIHLSASAGREVGPCFRRDDSREVWMKSGIPEWMPACAGMTRWVRLHRMHNHPRCHPGLDPGSISPLARL